MTVAWFSSTNHNYLLRTVTNEIASFFIDNRSRQMAFFFRLRQSGQRQGKGRLSRYVEIFWNKNASLLYKTNSSMLPCVCSVIYHRRRQNVVRTLVTHSATPRVPLFCCYHIFTSSVIYLWTDAMQHEIYLFSILCALARQLNMIITFFAKEYKLVPENCYENCWGSGRGREETDWLAASIPSRFLYFALPLTAIGPPWFERLLCLSPANNNFLSQQLTPGNEPG